MAKVFEQFHFSLIEREQPDFYEPALDREAWLRRAFAEQFEFHHRGKTFFWVPQLMSDDLVVGVIERKKVQTQRTPPDQGAREFEGELWTGSLVVIDPINRPDGQRVAFEDKASDVGQPSAILASLVAHLNSRTVNQYAVVFKALFRGDSFWRFAEKHGGRLEYVSFKFTVPNMIFNAGGGVKKGLSRIGKDSDAQEIDVRLQSPDGVRADSTSVREGMEYGEEGNAKVTAKALTGERWTSTARKLTVKMHSILNFSGQKTSEVQKWLEQALHRDSDSVDPGSGRSNDNAGSD